MEVTTITDIVSSLGFPTVVAGVAMWYLLKTSTAREAKMWETITGFQSVLNRFDSTLKDVASGLKDVKTEVDAVKNDVADLKSKVDK